MMQRKEDKKRKECASQKIQKRKIGEGRIDIENELEMSIHVGSNYNHSEIIDDDEHND